MPFMTPAEWRLARRVDHINVLGQGPRVLGRNNPATPNLKVWDADVAAYPAQTNLFDRMTVLGRLIASTSQWLQGPGAALAGRYQGAVTALLNSAITESSVIAGALHQAARVADTITAAAGGPLVPKQVIVNAIYVHPVGAPPTLVQQAAINTIINQHIHNANVSGAFVAAALTLNRPAAGLTLVSATAAGDSILLEHPPAPASMAGKLQDSALGGTRLVMVCNAQPAALGVDIVYVEDFDQNDIQGRTFRGGVDYGGAVPLRSIVAVRVQPPALAGAAATHGTTLLHEMCHALTHVPDHSLDPNNLMASGNIRNGANQLTAGQIGWMRNNAYV